MWGNGFLPLPQYLCSHKRGWLNWLLQQNTVLFCHRVSKLASSSCNRIISRSDQSSEQNCVRGAEAVSDDYIKHSTKLQLYSLSHLERSCDLLATRPAAWKMPVLLVIALLRL